MRRKILSAAALTATAVLVLTGCAPHVEVEDIPAYSIVQNPKDPFGPWKFSYLDSSGEQIPLDCPSVALFERRHCESADGLVSFSFSVRKSRPRISTITVDGVERSVTRVDTELENARRVWVPSDSLPAAP